MAFRYETVFVDFHYSEEEMQAITAAAFNNGNSVDEGGRYDWRVGGGSIAVWMHPTWGHLLDQGHGIVVPEELRQKIVRAYQDAPPEKRAVHPDNNIKAVFFETFLSLPLDIDAWRAYYYHTQTLTPYRKHFTVVEYNNHFTYEDALAELGDLERRALGRAIYGH